MRTNQPITSVTPELKTGYTIVLVSHIWNRGTVIKFKAHFATKPEAILERARMLSRPGIDADYRVVGPKALKELVEKDAAKRAERRQAGAKKASATRKKNGPNFICCPSCGAKSKKLFSEMGGLQTRQCQNGHRFEYDKWIADRSFWGPALGAGVPNPYKTV